MKFKEWFDSKLVVGRYPLPGEITTSDYSWIINVSDEYISYCHEAAVQSNIRYMWFPMSECFGNMGMNSIYGALQILFIAEKRNQKVYLHCHAGSNRSVTVADAYYYLRTGAHIIRKKPKEFEELTKWLGMKLKNDNNNRLLNNIYDGHLPSVSQIETFLKNCGKVFLAEETTKGGKLDDCKHLSNIHV